MAASLRPIPLPPAPQDDEDTLTWDEGIASLPLCDTPSVQRSLLTHHAVALGKSVVGTCSSPPTAHDDQSNSGSSSSSSNILWQTPLDSEILSLSSNSTGSIIAIATKTHVTLLKGCDGSILASRLLVSKQQQSASSHVVSPSVTFLTRTPSHLHMERDALLVSNGGETIILISNIDGERLNSSNLSEVQLAASEMSIEALSPPHSKEIILYMNGVCVDGTTIRFFFSGEEKRRVCVYDYNVEEKNGSVVMEDLVELIPGEWRYDASLEMDVTGTHLTVVANDEKKKVCICWFDVLSLSLVATYVTRSEIISMKAIRSCDPEQCVAVAFATNEKKGLRLHVVQSSIMERPPNNDDASSMVLFTIDTDSRARAIEVASPPATEERPYAFRFLTKLNNGENTYVEFVPGDMQQTGKVHCLLASHSFDEAYSCIDELEYTTNDAIRSPIHKSFVISRQFRHVLSKGNISEKENIIEAKECLRRLASGAISGGERGVEGLLDAAEFVLSWPKNQSISNVSAEFKTVSIQEVCQALSAMSTTVTSVIEVLSESKVVKLTEMKYKLDERQTALICLRGIAEVDGLRLNFDDPYLAVGSSVDLLHCLVSQGAFKTVERLMKSQWGKRIPSETLAASVLRIPVSVDPQCFLPWLCDLILPTLSIGDPLLETIRAWSCGAADKYDENNDMTGLDDAIMLLQAVSKATARLTVAMNSSYVQNMQPGSNTDHIDIPETPRHNNSSFFNSFDSKASTRSGYSRPTVLNVGMISGMKSKGSKVFSAKRVGRPLAESQAPSFPTAITTVAIDEELEYDCVEDKLKQAIRLKRARSLGMRRECLTLSHYSSKGEQFIVKELVKASLASNTTSQVGDLAGIAGSIRQYAIDANANFDEAAHQYAIELCDTSRDDIPIILYQSEKLCRLCSSPPLRCLIVLKMLRKALVSIQHPPDLSGLASEALSWVTDGNVKSELEEAMRLLAIDSLVRKYCGNGAQEFFRVNEASHSIRLVQHVCRHVDSDNVLADLLVLCDAFDSSVSKVDTCVSFVHRVMVARPRTIGGHSSRYEHVAAIMNELYLRDLELTERVGERLVALCSETLESTRHLILKEIDSNKAKQQAIIASSTACSILSVLVKIPHRESSLNTTLLREFQRLSDLQTGCDVFLTLEELREPSSRVSVLVNLLNPCVALLQQESLKFEDGTLREKLKLVIASAKHWCAILCDTPSQTLNIWSRSIGTVASHVAKTTQNHACLLLLEVSGILDERTGNSSFHSVISVALTLIGRASTEASNISNSFSFTTKEGEHICASLLAMKSIAQASLLLREHIILFAPPPMLPSSITLDNLTELLSNIAARFDLGIGEKLERYMNVLQSGSRKHLHQFKISLRMLRANNMLPVAPVIHPSWYIGDGLLLPLEILLLSMASFETILDIESNACADFSKAINGSVKASNVIHFLQSRGAHSTSLRLMSCSDSIALSRSSCLPFSHHLETVSAALAERSLGGIESGITSGAIDHLLSVSFLIGNLSNEKAFNIYQSALPSAISKRDFNRILILASIGVYCGVGTFSSGDFFPWSKQVKFIHQCNRFVTHAKMWGILSRYNVSFDPSVFTQSNDVSSSSLQSYMEKLVWNTATQLDPKSVLVLATSFAKYCDVDKHMPVSILIRFLLSIPDSDLQNGSERGTGKTNDIRRDLTRVEEIMRELCLPLLPIINQSKVLRRCVMALEESPECGSDYDRHNMVLTLYKECLNNLSSFATKETRKRALVQESGYIERRLNVIILLSTTFDDGYPPENKPDYTKMFKPLPSDPLQLSPPNQRSYHVVGYESSQHTFDPLAALHIALANDTTNALAASLSPICSLLGLPPGFVHARNLIVKFRDMKENGEQLPSPESSVFVVAKKMISPDDRAELFWWCSSQYEMGSSYQLKCLDLAHTNATLASERIELKSTEISTDEERYAIDRVRRIDLSRAMLSDQIIVNDVLASNPSTSEVVKSIYISITRKVQELLQTREYMPEILVKELLVEGSMAAAQASLDMSNLFTTSHFRSLAILIHDACRLLSTRYSHVNVGKYARAITRKWLIYGDEMITVSDADVQEKCVDDHEPTTNHVSKSTKITPINEDSELTSEFIMDIGRFNITSGDHAWSDQTAVEDHARFVKSSDEPSLFGSLPSQREVSCQNVNRCSLRIAFLMCFAHDYHQRESSGISDEDRDENTNINVSLSGKDPQIKASFLKASRQKANHFEGDLALAHAKELLGIVFAKHGCTIASTFAFMFEDSTDGNFSVLEEEKDAKNKALSFAMRHRAFRVASLLCPHDVILRVILEEGFSTDFDDDHATKIAFGSFLAMEIEAMGLSLPHSDLSQLSVMHFPSYARTLWRNHRGVTSSRLGGRLYLLILELSANHHENVDWDLLMLMMNEMIRLELRRSLLLACEYVVQSKAIERAAIENRNDVLHCISVAVKKFFEFMMNEVLTNIESRTLDTTACSFAVDRLLSIIWNMNEADAMYFAENFTALAAKCKYPECFELCQVMTSASTRISTHLSDSQSFRQVSSDIKVQRDGNSHVIKQKCFASVPPGCAESIQNYEKSFAPSDN